MAIKKEWNLKIENWNQKRSILSYRQLETIQFSGFPALRHLSIMEVSDTAEGCFEAVSKGTSWGEKWGYFWFKTRIVTPEAAVNHRLELKLDMGAECTVFVNGKVSGSFDKRHHYLTLARKAAAGEEFEIYVEGYAGHGNSRPVMNESSVGIWLEEIYQFLIDVDTLYQIRSSADENSLRVADIDRTLAYTAASIDFDMSDEELLVDVRAQRSKLYPLLQCVNGSTMPTLYMMGQSHLDVAWMWPIEETKRKIARTLSNQLALMEEYPDYIYTQSQPYLFELVQQLYPELYERIREAVQRGQLIPEGGMWLEADTNLTSGESLIRQFIHGKRFFKEQFGVDNEMLWMPDVFGYSGSLPQIMQGCGIRYFASVKMGQTYNNFVDPFPYNTFVWEGIDGSAVLAHFADYHLQTDPTSLIQNWNQRKQKEGISTRLAQFGYGDGGGGATRDELEFLKRCENLEGVPRVKLGSPIAYFKDLEQQQFSSARYVGELYYPAHRGTYTTKAQIKKGNRKCEGMLREAEMWGTAASVLGKERYPLKAMDSLWKRLLLNQFHDILPGTSIHRVHEEAEADFGYIMEQATAIAGQSQRSLLTVPSDNAITVYNSLSWERSAQVVLPDGWKGAKLASGEALPGQEDYGLITVTVAVPSCGWITLYSSTSEAAVGNESLVSASERILENELLRIELDAYGQLTSIVDKGSKLELASGICNRFQMYKDTPPRFDAWEIDRTYELGSVPLEEQASIRVLANGPLTAGVEVIRKLHQSVVRQQIWITAGSRVIEFRTNIDWQEKHKLLKVEFPVSIHTNEALHEIQFGYVKRPNHQSRPHDADRFEVSQYRWTALTEEDRGCALLNDSKYGINVAGKSMNLTLLRAPTNPDPQADQGTHEFTYAFYAWNGSLMNGEIVRRAYEINAPVSIELGESGVRSLFQIDKTNVILDTVKPAEDGSGDIIIRLYEALRSVTSCTLTTSLALKAAVQTDMLEQKEQDLSVISNAKINLQFRPFEIKTIRISLL